MELYLYKIVILLYLRYCNKLFENSTISILLKKTVRERITFMKNKKTC